MNRKKVSVLINNAYIMFIFAKNKVWELAKASSDSYVSVTPVLNVF